MLYIYMEWNTTQPEKMMKFCHLQKDGWTFILSEVSQTKKDRYCMISFICGIKLANKTEEANSQT